MLVAYPDTRLALSSSAPWGGTRWELGDVVKDLLEVPEVDTGKIEMF